MNENIDLTSTKDINLKLEDLRDSGFAAQFAHFLAPSGLEYAKGPLKMLSDRGIENRLLDNLLEYLPDNVCIAGGFVTNVLLDETNAKDIDFFFTTKQAFLDMVNLLQNPPDDAWSLKGYKLKEGTPTDKEMISDARYITFVHKDGKRPALQLIKMVFYESPYQIIDSFDFTIVQFAVDNKYLYYNPAAWLDLSRKRLVMHRCQFPASSLRRLIKYAQKGFYACPGSLVRICEEIQSFKGPLDANNVVYVD